jgi:hypothetical protein
MYLIIGRIHRVAKTYSIDLLEVKFNSSKKGNKDENWQRIIVSCSIFSKKHHKKINTTVFANDWNPLTSALGTYLSIYL